MGLLDWLFVGNKELHERRRAGHQAIIDAQAQQGTGWPEDIHNFEDGFHPYKPPERGEFSPYDIEAFKANFYKTQGAAFQAEVARGYFGQPKAERDAGELKDNQITGRWKE